MNATDQQASGGNSGPHRIRLVIHGGAGGITRELLSPEMEAECRAVLAEALRAGYAVLQNHGASLDAVETAIRILEDSPLFNAGRGATFTHAGTIELDASIMEGRTQRAGAVAALQKVRNPIALARLVMERSPHVMLTGEGAEAFAWEQGIEPASPDYFFTERRWDQLQKALEAEKAEGAGQSEMPQEPPATEGRHGTVGCVALDKWGNLSAGTSTGGMTGKWPGRVGDSPIIGAGTFADNATCAVSATGDGEFFIRTVAAHSVAVLMEHGGLGVAAAAGAMIARIGALGGSGGLIALDKDGNFAMPFNTEGMYRGYIDDEGNPVVQIFKE